LLIMWHLEAANARPIPSRSAPKPNAIPP
jgi:hypothetical protein